MLPRPPASLAVSPDFPTDGTLAVALGRTAAPGVMLSTDGGLHFSPWTTGLTDPYVLDVEIAEGGVCFAIGEDTACFRADAPLGAWKLYSDGFEPLSPQSDDHYAALDVSPTFGRDDTVLVGGFEGLYRSSDGGQTWDQSDLYSPRICRRLEFSPDHAHDGLVFLGSYGAGPLRFDARSDTWTARPGVGPSRPDGPRPPHRAAASRVDSSGRSAPARARMRRVGTSRASCRRARGERGDAAAVSGDGT